MSDHGTGGPQGQERSYTGGVGSRRELRERLLGLLYEAEVKSQPARALLAGLAIQPDPFVQATFVGVDEHRAEIDRAIADHAQGWAIERMPATDRAILRMATYELGWCPDIPTAVTISEAVELAKAYSTDDSGRFVNGVLSAVATQLRPAP